MTENIANKVVSRNVAIALGIMCVFLVATLIGVVAIYTSAITDKDQTILSKNQMISTRDSDISELQSQLSALSSLVNSLQSQWSNLQSQISNLTDIVNLEKSTMWIYRQALNQPEGNYSYWQFTAGFAGLVSVDVESSTSTTTYVEVVYSSYGVSYQNKITVGSDGVAVFPVLPASIEVRIGNSQVGGATEVVTVTYYY